MICIARLNELVFRDKIVSYLDLNTKYDLVSLHDTHQMKDKQMDRTFKYDNQLNQTAYCYKETDSRFI